MTTLVIVQARLGSTRLPGKVLMDIGGKPCLWHVMERVKLAGLPYILTIPEQEEADPTHELYGVAKHYGWPVSRGPHPDMMQAFMRAWQEGTRLLSRSIVRVTADCPFIQPADVIAHAGAEAYVSNAHPIRMVPKGLDIEGFRARELIEAEHDATLAEDRHHITPYFRRKYNLFTTTGDDGEFRVTLDTAEDLASLRRIAAAIDCTPPHPTLAELRAYFRSTGGIRP